jgi:hypothetical protein
LTEEVQDKEEEEDSPEEAVVASAEAEVAVEVFKETIGVSPLAKLLK